MSSATSKGSSSLRFPHHSLQPRVWLITAATSPIGIALIRRVLADGQLVVAGVKKEEICDEDDKRGDVLRAFLDDIAREGWRDKVRVVSLDGRNIALCQAAVAEAVEIFGRLDMLFCCDSEGGLNSTYLSDIHGSAYHTMDKAVIGTVEELSASLRSLALVRDQFETNYFGPVNIIKAVLPTMRKQMIGHIMVLTGITSHIGTPGLGIYCAAGWALEGFCDSLAYEIAPFNVKLTIVQPNLEVNILTNKITSAPLLPQYAAENHPAPLCRNIIGGLLHRIESVHGAENGQDHLSKLKSTEVSSHQPKLPPKMSESLLAETIHAVTAIAGHPNPPARHIVGFEGVASVKEKLQTVSEELEDFVEVSCAADIVDDLEPDEDALDSKENISS